MDFYHTFDQIRIYYRNKQFDIIEYKFKNIISKKYEDNIISIESLYFYCRDSHSLLMYIIKLAEKYNYKINIHRCNGLYLHRDKEWSKDAQHERFLLLEDYIYLTKHNYNYSYFLVIRPKDYNTDGLTIKKHIKYNKNSYIFNNNRKYKNDEKPMINLYNICYMIIII